jgi:prevent-host-death family protein
MSIDLRTLRFLPLSDVKAMLSERIRELNEDRSYLVVTVHGRPVAVLLSYDAFLSWAEPSKSADTTLDFDAWKRDRRRRRRVRDSVLGLFDVASLPRKGQKRYKREAVKALRRRSA